MKKIFKNLFILILLSSCGFSPVYVEKDTSNFSVQINKTVGDRLINNLISNQLNKSGDKLSENQIDIEYPSKNFQLGSKFNPHKEGVKYFLNDYFKLYNYFASRIFGNQNRGLLNKFNPKAADIEHIIDWTFTNFSKMNVKNKILLLQYPNNKNDVSTMKERDILITKAKKFNFIVIDTLEFLKKIDANLLWDGHHTAMGNKEVSNIILSTNEEIFYKR